VYEPEYVEARRVLLDALEALQDHLPSLVLVGAQAVYLHAGESDIAVAPYTTDADVAVAPELVADSPLIEDALTKRGFKRRENPGIWASKGGTTFDMLVPEALAGPGSRGADLGVHGRHAARRARGLEAALVQNSSLRIGGLDDSDKRTFEILVAGPAALTIAKVIKIGERLEDGRVVDKDALDVLRLFRGTTLEELTKGFSLLLEDNLSGPVTQEVVKLLPGLFGELNAPGVQMAMRSVAGVEDEEVIGHSLVALSRDLLESLG